MITTLEWIANWSSQLWPFMVNHLWQATLFALIVLATSHLVKKIPAKARHAVWLLALVKFALPSTIILFLAKLGGVDFGSIFNRYSAVSQTDIPIAPAITSIAEPVLQQNSNTALISMYAVLYIALTIIWLVVCAAFLALWVNRRVQLSRAIMAGQLVFSGKEAEALKRVKTWLLIDRDIDLILSPRVNEPGVWRVWNPVMVLPAGIADHLTEAELDTVIMHELFHVTRRDNLFGNLQMVLCCLFWFHPIVWLIDRKLLAERERACDEAVINHSGTSLIYASGILKVCRMGLTPGWKVAGVSGVSGSNLDKRIEHIMKNTSSGSLKTAHWILVGGLAVFALCLSLGAGIFSRSTVRAQSVATSDSRTFQTGETVEVPIHFRNEGGYTQRLPFLLSNAKAEVTKVEPTSVANDSVWAANSDHYKIRIKVTLENNWSQQLTGLGVFLTNEESTWRVYIEQMNLSIEPLGQFEFERQIIITLTRDTSLGTLLVTPASGQSEGGDTWGKPVPSMLLPPPPPPPPFPPGAGHPPASPLPPPPPLMFVPQMVPPTPISNPSLLSEVIDGVPGGVPGGIPGGVPEGVHGGVPGGEHAKLTYTRDAAWINQPEYTEEARKNKTQGTVRLRALTSEEGKVEEAEIIQGLPDGLNEQALKCVNQARFLKGERRWINVRVVFSMTD